MVSFGINLGVNIPLVVSQRMTRPLSDQDTETFEQKLPQVQTFIKESIVLIINTLNSRKAVYTPDIKEHQKIVDRLQPFIESHHIQSISDCDNLQKLTAVINGIFQELRSIILGKMSWEGGQLVEKRERNGAVCKSVLPEALLYSLSTDLYQACSKLRKDGDINRALIVAGLIPTNGIKRPFPDDGVFCYISSSYSEIAQRFFEAGDMADGIEVLNMIPDRGYITACCTTSISRFLEADRIAEAQAIQTAMPDGVEKAAAEKQIQTKIRASKPCTIS